MAHARNLAIVLLPLRSWPAPTRVADRRPGIASTASGSPSAEEDVGGQSPYGLFLAGQAAFDGGHSDTAARYFSRAAAARRQRAGAANPGLHRRPARRRRRQGRRAGAPRIPDRRHDRAPGRAHPGGRRLGGGPRRRGPEDLHQRQVGAPHNAAAALLAPFAAAAAGDAEGSVVRPVIPERAARRLLCQPRPGPALRARRPVRRGRDRLSLPDRDRRCRRRAESGPWRDAGAPRPSERCPGDLHPGPGQVRRRRRASGRTRRVLAHGKAPSAPTIRQDAAEALIAQSTEMVMQKQQEGALAYLRLALRLDPDRGEAWTMVGDILSNIGDLEGARAAYLQPKPGADQYAEARDKLAWSYQSAGDKPMALKIARETVADSSDQPRGGDHPGRSAARRRAVRQLHLHPRSSDRRQGSGPGLAPALHARGIAGGERPLGRLRAGPVGRPEASPG